MRLRDLEGLRAVDFFFDVPELARAARAFVVDDRLVAVRFVRVDRFLAVVLREPAFLAGAFFVLDLVLVDRFAPVVFVRVVRFFAVVLRGPDFRAVVRLDLELVDRFAVLVFARVRRLFAGALRPPAFLAGAFAFFAGDLLVWRVCLMVKPVPGVPGRAEDVPAVATSGCGAGPPSCATISSVAPGSPRARRPARQPAIVSAPRP